MVRAWRGLSSRPIVQVKPAGSHTRAGMGSGKSEKTADVEQRAGSMGTGMGTVQGKDRRESGSRLGAR